MPQKSNLIHMRSEHEQKASMWCLAEMTKKTAAVQLVVIFFFFFLLPLSGQKWIWVWKCFFELEPKLNAVSLCLLKKPSTAKKKKKDVKRLSHLSGFALT